MKKGSNDRLLYFPAWAQENKNSLRYSSTCLVNAVYPPSPKKLDILKGKRVFCDSGGRRILRELKAGNTVAFGPKLRTNPKDPHTFTLGVEQHCRFYSQFESPLAMSIDFPAETGDSDHLYNWKLAQSCAARDHFLTLAPNLCPNVELVIALQPRGPRELEQYFRQIYTPAVTTYAWPAKYRNSTKYALGNAYVLSYLHWAGIRHVHFLGSSSPAVIFILSWALALGLFERLSFDSLSWNTRVYDKPRFLQPENLSLTSEPLDPQADLRTELNTHPGLDQSAIKQFISPEEERVIAKDWVGILNVLAIERFKNEVLENALANDLFRFLTEFRKRGYQNGKLVDALHLLEDAREHGHKYVKQKYFSRL